jgi:transcriptional regulator GlxA family with amidase domain
MAMYRTIRLNKALELLQTTRMPIGEIALATGFSNQSHFSTGFRKQFAITPRQARTHDAPMRPKRAD